MDDDGVHPHRPGHATTTVVFLKKSTSLILFLLLHSRSPHSWFLRLLLRHHHHRHIDGFPSLAVSLIAIAAIPLAGLILDPLAKRGLAA